MVIVPFSPGRKRTSVEVTDYKVESEKKEGRRKNEWKEREVKEGTIG